MNHETLFNSAANTRKIDTIIVHCAAVRPDSGVTIDDIKKWHLQRQFRDIGYHFVIDEKGRVWKGRPLEEMGAHCKGHNQHSIGICYIGGLDDQGQSADTRTPVQQLAIKHLIGLLINEFKIYDVLGHRDLSPDVNGDGQITSVDWLKMCPCYDVHQEWLQYLREMALVSRNYVYAQTHSGESITPELRRLCDAAEEYLHVEWCVPSPLSGAYDPVDSDYNPERDDNASFSLMNDSNEPNPVPPLPDTLSQGVQTNVYKPSLGGWRGMNWRRWGCRRQGIRRN